MKPPSWKNPVSTDGAVSAAAWSASDDPGTRAPAQMPKMQRNDSVELSSLLPHRPSNWANTVKCLRKLTSVDNDAPWVGTEEPWNVSESPTVSSEALIRPSPL